ncbi:MAG TPA: Nramp family divalent metal transporter [Rhodanobacteraceae bacterium]|nr:Nramp family divalent metal transporter [Rhodanobacteraceae bacterium]
MTRIRNWLRSLGPGLITGAADDDPAGIATYSVVGAQFGNAFLWSAFVTWPLMACAQMTCARIGLVSGAGLGSAIRKKLPRWVGALLAIGLLAANAINIAADLAGMGEAMSMLHLGPALVYVALFGVALAVLGVRLPYATIARVLKWLALALLAYVVSAFLAKPDWSRVLHDVFVPSLPRGKDQWEALVAILGTTISPYLFYWQAGQEIEEQKDVGKMSERSRVNASRSEIRERRIDVASGTIASNLVMFFIILTASATLHAHGTTHIETTKQAAEALRPVAGDAAFVLFTIGLVGTGLLAIPTLAGSAAYAFAETFDWRYGLNEKFRRAVPFYGVYIAAIIGGIVLNLVGVSAVRALVWSAIVNGLLAPVVLFVLLAVIVDAKLMKGQQSPKIAVAIVALTALLMTAAGIAMFV